MYPTTSTACAAFTHLQAMLPDDPSYWDGEPDTSGLPQPVSTLPRNTIVDYFAHHDGYSTCPRTKLYRYFELLRDDLRSINHLNHDLREGLQVWHLQQFGTPANYYVHKHYTGLKRLVRTELFKGGVLDHPIVSHLERAGFVFWVEDQKLFTKIEGHLLFF